MGVIQTFSESIIELYNGLILLLPPWAQSFVNLFILVMLVVIYSIFIWKFYRFIAKKNFLELNLEKYNQYQSPFVTKLLIGALYFLEYLILSPFLIFIWFAIFTIFLIILTEGQTTANLLIISAIIIAAIRITSYYKEDLAKDLAKVLPLTLLAVAITKSDFFNAERILGQFSQIPEYFGTILIYLIFIIVLEALLRFFYFIFSIFGLEEEEEVEIEQVA